jgi:hypothetical protein
MHLAADIEFLVALRTHLPIDEDEILEQSLSQRWYRLGKVIIEDAIKQDTVDAALEYVNDKLAIVFERANYSSEWKKEIVGEIYRSYAFKNLSENNRAAARYCWLQAIRNNMGWLRNRGAISLGVRLLLPPYTK